MPTYFNPDEPLPQPTGGGGGGDWVGALIGAGTAVYTTIEQKKAQERQNQANRELAQYQYDKQLEMWNLQNDYNSPLNQINRLKAGGLNPALMYGSGAGGGVSGNASDYPKYNAPNMVQEFAPITQALPEMINAYQSFKMRQAQIDNVKANTRATDTRAAADALRPSLMGTQINRNKQLFDQSEGLFPYNLSIKESEAEASQYKTIQEYKRIGLMSQQQQRNVLDFGIKGEIKANLQQEFAKKQEEINYLRFRNSLAKKGITPGDNIMLRMMYKQMDELGLVDSFSNGLSEFVNQKRKK